VSSSFKILQAKADSPHLSGAAELHVKYLPGTLTSQRGAKTTAGMYRYLVRQGHAAYLALARDNSASNELAGGLIVMRHACKQSKLFLVAYRPWSWLITLRALGIRKAFTQSQDLARLQNAAKQLGPHDYIAAVYVAESSRRLGLARQLIEYAIAEATSRGVGIAVDTTLTNESAKNLYQSLGFAEFYRTNVSVQFTLGLA
jgi:ribosomal protein S18 acetylase RimI-like enzyme